MTSEPIKRTGYGPVSDNPVTKPRMFNNLKKWYLYSYCFLITFSLKEVKISNCSVKVQIPDKNT